MRRDYKYLYQAPPIPFARPTRGYTDPVETDEERRGEASRLAKQRAELRRAKIAERWVVFTAAALLAIMMLPVLAVAGAAILARVLWRRYVGGGERPRTSVTAHGIHMPTDSSSRGGTSERPEAATRDRRSRRRATSGRYGGRRPAGGVTSAPCHSCL